MSAGQRSSPQWRSSGLAQILWRHLEPEDVRSKLWRADARQRGMLQMRELAIGMLSLLRDLTTHLSVAYCI